MGPKRDESRGISGSCLGKFIGETTPGCCTHGKIYEIQSFFITSKNYVGLAVVDDDGEQFAERPAYEYSAKDFIIVEKDQQKIRNIKEFLREFGCEDQVKFEYDA